MVSISKQVFKIVLSSIQKEKGNFCILHLFFVSIKYFYCLIYDYLQFVYVR